MSNEREIEKAAAQLANAEATRSPVAPPSKHWPGMTREDAYAVQFANITMRCAAGAIHKGYKIGLTSASARLAVGAPEPNFGHLVSDMFLPEWDGASFSQFFAPRVEMELAFVLNRPLPPAGCSVVDVLRATEFLLPVIEIVDSRICSNRIHYLDAIADNSCSSAVILGGRPIAVGAYDLGTVGAVLWRNGEIAETGSSARVLGNPARSVAWLANTLAQFSLGTAEGHVVLPGSCTEPIGVRGGDFIRADFGPLGSAEIRFHPSAETHRS